MPTLDRQFRLARRNRVDEIHAVVIAAVAGVVAVFAGAEPTGSPVVDGVGVFLTAAIVTWAAASAPWWAAAIAAGAGALIAFQPVVAVVGYLAFFGALYVGVTRRDHPELRAIVGGVAVNVLIRSNLDEPFGLSAIVGIIVCAGLFVLGLARRPRTIRRRAWQGVAGLAVLAVLGSAALAATAVSARPDLEQSATIAEQGIAALNDGDFELAAQRFDDAAAGFERAGDRLSGPLAMPAKLLPGVAQNVDAGADVSAGAADALRTAADALRDIDTDSLRVIAGAIDIDAVRAVEAPLVRVRAALADLQTVTAAASSPWLVAPIQDELAELEAEFDENVPKLDSAIETVRLAPALLGADESRTYLIMFTTPSEVRGLGGFTGGVAEVTVEQGRVSAAEFERTAQLNGYIINNGASCAACPAEFLERYGRFGFTSGEGGAVGDAAWSDLTMAAHFPDVAKVAQVLYPQSGGVPIDGVIVMDPYVVAALMKYSGPVEVPELDVVVTAENAAQFLLYDQYVLAEQKGIRVEALESLGEGAIEGILRGALPEPADLARDLGPLVEERRLLMWTDDPEEQQLLDDVGLLGAIPPIDDVDGGFSVSVTNGGNSKIDWFLDRDVEVAIEERDDGSRVLVADVRLTNDSPTSGLPEYVIGNTRDLPNGTSRLWVTFYGPPVLTEITRDGEPIQIEPGTEAGWGAFSEYVQIEAGGTVQYRLVFELGPDVDADGETTPAIWEQPIAHRSEV